MVWLWGVILFIALAVEIFTFEFVSGWFSVGALVSFVLALCGVNWIVQTVVFVALSLALMFSLRKVCLKSFGYKFHENDKSKSSEEEQPTE